MLPPARFFARLRPEPDLALIIARASRHRPCDILILTLKHKFTSFGNFVLVRSPYRSLQR
jgi:hypothetical protein